MLSQDKSTRFGKINNESHPDHLSRLRRASLLPPCKCDLICADYRDGTCDLFLCALLTGRMILSVAKCLILRHRACGLGGGASARSSVFPLNVTEFVCSIACLLVYVSGFVWAFFLVFLISKKGLQLFFICNNNSFSVMEPFDIKGVFKENVSGFVRA